eukprot:PhM_4_TR4052/c0_g2_i1/m.99502
MEFNVQISHISGATPGCTYCVRWRQKKGSREGMGESPHVVASATTGEVKFDAYSFEAVAEGNTPAGVGEGENVSADLTLSVFERADGPRDWCRIHRLGLVLSAFAGSDASPLVRNMGSGKSLHFTVIPKKIVAAPKDNDVVEDGEREAQLEASIAEAESTVASLDAEIEATRNAIVEMRQKCLARALPPPESARSSSSQRTPGRNGVSFAARVAALQRKQAVDNLKHTKVMLQVDIAGVKDALDTAEAALERSKARTLRRNIEADEMNAQLKDCEREYEIMVRSLEEYLADMKGNARLPRVASASAPGVSCIPFRGRAAASRSETPNGPVDNLYRNDFDDDDDSENDDAVMWDNHYQRHDVDDDDDGYYPSTARSQKSSGRVHF